METFSTAEDRASGKVRKTDVMTTHQFTMVVKEVEPEYWLVMVVTHENLYSDVSQATETISNLKKLSSVFEEEDSE